ncbi:MAG TPA: IS110 family transposase [Candidatus Binataceae bacterium]|nr:IS110 family transposase [Candidatus Binataceae bacterium]
MLFAGIDIGSERHMVAIVDQSGAVLLRATAVTEDATGYKRLLELLGSASDCLVAMEATGHYWRNLFAALVTAGFKIALINPLRSSRFAEEELQRTKTDAIDAPGLARFAAQKRPSITQLPESALLELRELVRLKDQLIQQFGDRVRQLHRAVGLGFPEFTRHVRTLDSQLAISLLARYPTAAALRTVSARRLARLCYDGSHNVGEELARALLAAAKQSVAAHHGEPYQLQMRYACEDLSVLRRRLRSLDSDIERRLQQHEIGKLLTTIEGIGPQTAARIIAEVGDPARFHSGGALASYVGVIPRVHQSGKRKFSSAAKVPLGNARLRRALWMPALTAIKHNPWLRAYYQRLRSAGKQPKVALVAIIRKLMTAVYSVAKHRRPFVLPPIYTPAAGGAVVALAH